ncbi:MAG: FecR domain-containing protein [Kiritimatiellae bacterium]|nr:FecR domain-containing protein [Kiritimatiellia bacterium]
MNEEFDNLLADCLDAEQPEREAPRLAERIRRDPRLARRFREELSMHILMRELAAETLAGDTVVAPRRRQAGRPPVRPRAIPRPPVDLRSATWPRWITGVAAAILLGLGFVLQTRMGKLTPIPGRPATAELSAMRGEVRLSRDGKTLRPSPRDALHDGDALQTAGPDAMAAAAFADGTRVEWHGPAAARLDSVGQSNAKRIYQTRGRLVADVTRQPPGREMQVDTPHAELRVIGTRFEVDVSPESTRVDMRTGQTRVTCKRTGQAEVLAAGYLAMVGKSLVVAARPQVGGRTQTGLIALYTFEEQAGGVVHDTAPFGMPLDLIIPNEAARRWLPGGGLAIDSNARVASRGPASKIFNACRASRELTLEAWIKPAGIAQGADNRTGPARIVSVSRGGASRNVTLAQRADTLIVRVHTTNTDPDGQLQNPNGRGNIDILEAPLGPDIARPLHAVVTYAAASGEARLYVDGEQRAARQLGGDFRTWQSGFRLLLASEDDGEKWWLGEFHLVAIYSRALSAAQVRAHYQAGHGHASRAAAR